MAPPHDHEALLERDLDEEAFAPVDAPPDRWVVARGEWQDARPAMPSADPGLLLITELRRRDLILRRAFDLTVGSVMLVATVPVMVVVAVLIRLTSRGPVLFRHGRVGRGGELFEVLKFRTMRHGTHDELHAEADKHAEYVRNDFKLPSDSDSITRVGRVLRKLSLDELPQLLNVLKGDMSVVGIRPLVPPELLLRPLADQLRYCQLRPGITGLWQVSGRSTVTTEDRYELDRRYLTTWRPRHDVAILLRTTIALLRTHQAG